MELVEAGSPRSVHRVPEMGWGLRQLSLDFPRKRRVSCQHLAQASVPDGVAEWLQEAVSGNGHSDGPSALRLHLVDARLHRDTERMPGKNPRAKAAKGRSKSQAQRDLQGLAA